MKKNQSIAKRLASLLCLLLLVGATSAQHEKKFLVTGDSSWTVPAQVDGKNVIVTSVTFEAWGGGGAGGYLNLYHTGREGAGGGGGGAFATLTQENPTGTYNIHAGQGGTNPSARGAETTTHGDASKVTYEENVIVNAAGGLSVIATQHNTILNEVSYYSENGAQGGRADDCIPQEGAIGGGTGGNANVPLNPVSSWSSGKGGDAANQSANPESGSGAAIRQHSPTIFTDGYGGNPGNLYGGGGSGAVARSSQFVGYRIRLDGGEGAPGVVRVSYTYTIVDAEVQNDTFNVCSGVELKENLSIICDYPQNIEITSEPVNAPENLSVNISGIGYDADEEAIIITATATNNTSETIPFTVNCKATYMGHEYPFSITVNVYGKLDAGTITNDQFVCQGQSIQTITSGQGATGGSGDGSYEWWQYVLVDENNVTVESPEWAQIEGANAENYTPNLNGIRQYTRKYVDDECGTISSNTLLITTANPLEISNFESTEDTVCSNETYSKNIAFQVSTPASQDPSFSWGTYWQQSRDKGDSWANVTEFQSESDNYNISLSELNPGDDIWYRAAVKINDCDSFPGNSIFKIHVQALPDYTASFEDLTIRLDIGAQDTAIQAPDLGEAATVDGPYSTEDLTTDAGRLAIGDYTIYWNVEATDDCGTSTQVYPQKVKVIAPACEGTNDASGNEYEAVRIGNICWLTENLRANTSSSVYYNDNQSNSNFGRLYTWADAMTVCPDGWSLPTMEQYNALLTESIYDLKSDDENAWLPGMNGSNASGFGIMGAGLYENTLNTFKDLRGYAGFWTADEQGNKAKVFYVTYACDGGRDAARDKNDKLSVRCVKEQ